ncbi:MAG: hypothetical protein N3A68_02645 [Bacteroidia bacterium]|nr:hypothetical protein [Bacteroidia bacterium]GIV23166.1 MAG: hypothetical protein KatS3mg025_0825 [Bacteroidia bacterium]
MRRPVVLLFSLWLGTVGAQCPTNFPPPPSCDNCDGYLDASDNGKNVVIPANRTFCIRAGVTVSPASLDIRKDATLIVCGTLTLTGDLNLGNNGSSLWVAPGGTLNASGLNANAQTNIYNYGTMHLAHLNLNGSNAAFYNIGTGAQLLVQNSINVNAATQFINHQGLVQAQSFTLNGTAQACLSEGACLSVTNFTNNGNGAITVTGSAPVALSFTGTATLNGTVTNSNLLYVCQAPGATTNNPGNWGSAQVYSNCTSGCGVLPIVKLHVQGALTPEDVHLRWTCEGACATPAYYTIGLYDAGRVQVLTQSPHTTLRLSKATLPARTEWTFLVSGWSAAGEKLAEGHLTLQAESLHLTVWPNPFTDKLHYTYTGTTPAHLTLYNAAGAIVARFTLEPGSGTLHADDHGQSIDALPKGLYLLTAHTDAYEPLTPPYRLVK